VSNLKKNKSQLTAIKKANISFKSSTRQLIKSRDAIGPNKALLKQLKALPKSDPAVWKQVALWLESGMIGDSILRGHGPKSYKRIHEFSLGTPISEDQYRYWHVDDLLEQMASLIDRAISERDELREKISKAFYVESEVMQYRETDYIYLQEVRNGLYVVPYTQAKQEAEAERLYHVSMTEAEKLQQQIHLNHYSSTNRTNQLNAERKAAFVSHFSNSASEDKPPYKQVTYGNDKQFVYAHLVNAADTRTRWQLDTAVTSVLSEMYVKVGNRDASGAKLIAAQSRSDWEGKNALYKKERADVARKYGELKVAAFTMPDGVLNYNAQMAGLKDRLARDTNDALSRMFAVVNGLKKIYGYEQRLSPQIQKAIKSRIANDFALDHTLIWVRNTIAWLNRFKQLDQNYILPISLRTIIGNDSIWETGKQNREWDIKIAQSPHFDGQSHVRLRGVRGYIYGCGQEAGFWRIDITPPLQAVTQHLNTKKLVNLDQSLLPKVLLPRVGSRLNTQEVEFVGTTALHNASPIGQWKLR